MKRESSQTTLPVAVREVCSCRLESFVAGSVGNMLKQTHMPQRSLSSLGLQRRHTAPALRLWKGSQVRSSPWLSWVPAPRPQVPQPPPHPLWCPEYRAQEGPLKHSLPSWGHLPAGSVQLHTAGSWQMSEPCRTKSALLTRGASQSPGMQTHPCLQYSLDHTLSKRFFFTYSPGQCLQTLWHDDIMSWQNWWGRGAPGGWRSRLPWNILQYTQQPLKHKQLLGPK